MADSKVPICQFAHRSLLVLDSLMDPVDGEERYGLHNIDVMRPLADA